MSGRRTRPTVKEKVLLAVVATEFRAVPAQGIESPGVYRSGVSRLLAPAHRATVSRWQVFIGLHKLHRGCPLVMLQLESELAPAVKVPIAARQNAIDWGR